jgi:hypothetical protein
MRTSSAPIILAIVVAATAAVSDAARAGDDCLAAPNAGAPQGSHWYYRFDRGTRRKCWYVGAQGTKVRRAATATPPTSARAPVAPPSVAPAPVDVPAPASAPASAPAPAAAVAAAPDAAFSSRWPDRPNATDAIANAPAPDAGQSAAPAARVPDRIAARAVTTTAEPAPTAAQPQQAESARAVAAPPATAAVADQRPSLPAALAAVAVLLASVGTILVRAGRRAAAGRSPHWARSFDEGAMRAARPSLWDEVRSPDERRAPRYPGTSLMRATTDIAETTLQPEIDPMPAEPTPGLSDPGAPAPDVEQSLRQLLQAWERRAA